MAENSKSKERLKEITDSIEQGIKDLFLSDRYAQYLRTMSRFHRYSVNNTMLIYMQKLDATLVAGFNNEHPADYHRPSLFVSDIVALKQDGVVSCHYVDSFGFQEIPAFLKPENYLKSAEMSIEDDYDMIDGVIDNGKNPTVAELEQQAKTGQPISLLEPAEASRREHDEKKKSVVEQLRSQPVSREHKKTAPDRGAEMER